MKKHGNLQLCCSIFFQSLKPSLIVLFLFFLLFVYIVIDPPITTGEERVIRVVSNVMKIPSSAITDKTTLEELNCKPKDYNNIIRGLENEFSIDLSDLQKMNSLIHISDLHQIVKARTRATRYVEKEIEFEFWKTLSRDVNVTFGDNYKTMEEIGYNHPLFLQLIERLENKYDMDLNLNEIISFCDRAPHSSCKFWGDIETTDLLRYIAISIAQKKKQDQKNRKRPKKCY